jgi:peptidoglycan/xylan/chitin deacetylase (PgdA/CDA1 family)
MEGDFFYDQFEKNLNSLYVTFAQKTMNRRTFNTLTLQTLFVAPVAKIEIGKKPTHIVTLSFDDGFQKSFVKVAEIYEKLGLKACFNVIAAGHLPDFIPPDRWVAAAKLGDFGLWNELKARGHEVMPHSWQHFNYTRIPLQEMKDDVNRCLDYFDQHLKGFRAEKSVFNLPFNASNPEIEDFLLSKVKAIRTKLPNVSAHNPFPKKGTRKISCESFGEARMDSWLEEKINAFLATDGGWLVINTHGLDDEGWGPLGAECLERTLERLTQMAKVAVLPTGKALKKFR